MNTPIAIPSYRRDEIITERTLPMLVAGGVDPATVTIYVADQVDADIYSATLDPDTYGQIINLDYRPTRDAPPGHPSGLGAARNVITRAHPPGTRLVQIDDDIRGLIRKIDDKTTEPVTDIPAFIAESFTAADSAGAHLWGIYPVKNPMFMKHRVRTDLTYICGGLFGTTLRHDPCELVALDDKEDFERSLRFYDRDGTVARVEHVALLTQGYTAPGGMQDTRSAARVDESARWLHAQFPDLCSLNLTKKSGWTELRLRDRRA